MNNEIKIALCLDNNYFEPSYLLINSIIKTNSKSKLFFYIVYAQLKENYINKFSSLSSNTISFIYRKIDISDFKDCPIRQGDHVSLATYFRLMLPIVLPESVSKILYLDGDMLCFNSIQALYNTDINQYSLGACYDSQCYNKERKSILALKDSTAYFAAGVLLINLEYWRKNKVHQKAMKYIQENSEKLIWHDQDTLNAILEGTVMYLDFQYNFYETYFKRREKSSMTDELWNRVIKSKESICLLHFSQAEKPWYYECEHPLKDLWRKYYKIVLGHKAKLKFKYSGKARISFIKRKILSKVFHFPMNPNYEAFSSTAIEHLYNNLTKN